MSAAAADDTTSEEIDEELMPVTVVEAEGGEPVAVVRRELACGSNDGCL